jgi:hypothetical protein
LGWSRQAYFILPCPLVNGGSSVFQSSAIENLSVWSFLIDFTSVPFKSFFLTFLFLSVESSGLFPTMFSLLGTVELSLFCLFVCFSHFQLNSFSFFILPYEAVSILALVVYECKFLNKPTHHPNSAPKKAALLGGKAKRRGSGGGIFAFPLLSHLGLHRVLLRAAREGAGGAAASFLGSSIIYSYFSLK